MAILVLLFHLIVFPPEGAPYDHLIGKPMPRLEVTEWLNTKGLSEQDLKGKVVLVRWWTGPFCPYCIHSSAALTLWYQTYQDRGLTIIGMYHHKSRRPLELKEVGKLGEKMGFTFPIGIDRDWKNLKKWWLEPVPEIRFTSVSFLIDRKGLIRYIHPGGEYVKGDGDYEALEKEIIKWLE